MDDKRYVAVRIQGAAARQAWDEGRLKAELTRALSSVLGVIGMAEVEPSLISYDAKGDEMIVRTKRGEERKLIAALTLVTSFGGQPARLEALRISGTIKRLRMKRQEDEGKEDADFGEKEK